MDPFVDNFPEAVCQHGNDGLSWVAVILNKHACLHLKTEKKN